MMLLAALFLLTAPLQDPGQSAGGPTSARAEAIAAGPRIFRQVYANWTVNCDVPGIQELRIAFDVELDSNGAIVGRPVPVRPQNTPVYQAAAAEALRALLVSAPFEAPEGFQGGVYRPTFLPGRVCNNADEL